MEPLLVKRESCPLCKAGVPAKGERFFIRQLDQTVRVIECPVCGVVYKEMQLTARGLDTVYHSGYAHHKGGAGEADWGAADYVRRMRLAKGCRHLDYGCGNGHVVDQARRVGVESYGVDPFLPDSLLSGSAGAFFRGQAADRGILQKIGLFDAVSMWAVIEHLDQPLEVFKGLSGVLKTGGYLFFNAPNGDCVTARKDGGHWSVALLVEHSTFWTKQAVEYLAVASGLSVCSVRTCGTPYPLNRRSADWASFGVSPACANLGEEPRAGTEEDASGSAFTAKFARRMVVAGRKLVKNRFAGQCLRLALHLSGLGDHYYVVLKK